MFGTRITPNFDQFQVAPWLHKVQHMHFASMFADIPVPPEGQFAVGVIGFMLVMGGWMLVMALKKSRGKG